MPRLSAAANRSTSPLLIRDVVGEGAVGYRERCCRAKGIKVNGAAAARAVRISSPPPPKVQLVTSA
jgi:hypothetical protein